MLFPIPTSSLLVPDCHYMAPHLLWNIPVDFPDSAPVVFQFSLHIAASIIFLKTNWNSHCTEDKLSPVLDSPVCSGLSPLPSYRVPLCRELTICQPDWCLSGLPGFPFLTHQVKKSFLRVLHTVVYIPISLPC